MNTKVLIWFNNLVTQTSFAKIPKSLFVYPYKEEFGDTIDFANGSSVKSTSSSSLLDSQTFLGNLLPVQNYRTHSTSPEEG